MSKKRKKSKGNKLIKGFISLIEAIGKTISLLPKGLYIVSEKIWFSIVGLFSKQTKLYDETTDNIALKDSENKQITIPVAGKMKNVKATHESFKVIETKTGNFREFEDYLNTKPSSIGIILGKRGSGKSAIGLKLLENIIAKTNKQCYAMGFEVASLPSFITSIEDISQIKNNSFVLIDEGGILFSSRNAMSTPNKILSELILVARHKDLSIIFISQNSSNLDVNIIRQADYLIMKPSSLLQEDFERKVIKEAYTDVKQEFKKYSNILGITYIYSDDFRGFVTNPLPSFWSTSLSKSFKDHRKN